MIEDSAMWEDLKFQAVEFWRGHKVGGTLIVVVIAMVIISQLIDLFQWIF